MKIGKSVTWFGYVQVLYIVLVILASFFLVSVNYILESKYDELSKNIIPTVDMYSSIERIQLSYERLYEFTTRNRDSFENLEIADELDAKIQTIQAGFFVLVNSKSRLSKVIKNTNIISALQSSYSKFNTLAGQIKKTGKEKLPYVKTIEDMDLYRDDLLNLNGIFYKEQIKQYESLVFSISEANSVFKFVVVGWLIFALVFAAIILIGRALSLRLYKQRKKAFDHKFLFVSMFNHEIRNPLQIIASSIDNMKDLFDDVRGYKIQKNDLSTKLGLIEKEVSVIDGQFSRVEIRINEFANFARLESGKIKENLSYVDVSSLADEIVFSFRADAALRNILIHLTKYGNLAEVVTDRNKLDVILRNLLDNALKYTSSGSIKISVSLKKHHSKYLEISVSDTGCGIVAEDLDAIFEPFVKSNNISGKSHGSSVGLGLSIVKMLVKILGGGIKVKSNVNEGSTFTIKIPVC